jgi:TRAP-type C4-dicarboxylate transport system substrate-binding protein
MAHRTSLGGKSPASSTWASVVALALAALAWSPPSHGQDAKHYRFAYDQPRNTGYSIAGDIFAERLKELSKGTMLIDQYPGAQLGSRRCCS